MKLRVKLPSNFRQILIVTAVGLLSSAYVWKPVYDELHAKKTKAENEANATAMADESDGKNIVGASGIKE